MFHLIGDAVQKTTSPMIAPIIGNVLCSATSMMIWYIGDTPSQHTFPMIYRAIIGDMSNRAHLRYTHICDVLVYS